MSSRYSRFSRKEKDHEQSNPSILPEYSGKQYKVYGTTFPKKVIAWNDVPDALVQRTLMTYVRRWVYGIAHYADYAIQRLEQRGIVCEQSFSAEPTLDGFTIHMNIRIKYIDAEKLGERYKSVMRILKKYREFQEFLDKTEEEADIELDQILNKVKENGRRSENSSSKISES